MKFAPLALLFLSACRIENLQFDYLNANEEQTARLDCGLSIVEDQVPHFTAGGKIEVVDYLTILGFWQIDKDNNKHEDMYIKIASADNPSVQVLTQGLVSIAGWSELKEEIMARVFYECD